MYVSIVKDGICYSKNLVGKTQVYTHILTATSRFRGNHFIYTERGMGIVVEDYLVGVGG